MSALFNCLVFILLNVITKIKTVPINFRRLDKMSNEWYTPYSTHFINRRNYCSKSHYQIKLPY